MPSPSSESLSGSSIQSCDLILPISKGASALLLGESFQASVIRNRVMGASGLRLTQHTPARSLRTSAAPRSTRTRPAALAPEPAQVQP